MNAPGILVVGERMLESKALVDAIRSDQTKCNSASNPLWTIDNKYYTVQVAISTLTTMNDFNSLSLTSHIDYQAVVAVFNAAVDTLDTMQRVWDSIEDHESEFEIKLAVLLCHDRESNHLPVIEKANVMFSERCAELVVVEDFERIGASGTTLAEEGWHIEGMDRIIEALQAHLWPGMQRKASKTERLNGGTYGQEIVTDAEPSIAALLQQTLAQEDNLEGDDEADKLFGEILEFRQKMGGASRVQRADAAAEIVTRLHALMGETSEESGSMDNSDDDEAEETSSRNHT